tara:strand:+ start:731 stop:1756 length:1026 start_codon:yes stop_codon:yes gene_type:complete
MIKVKIQNAQEGRNEPTFRPLLMVSNMLRDYHIDITESDSYDYLFVGMNDFIDKSQPLQQSIDYGLETLSKISGDYLLFDGSDSTSLMGAYEVLEQSNALFLMKNQKFYTREEYATPYAFNKWFFGTGSGLDLSYDISKENWNKIKFSGYNLGYLLPQYRNYQPISTDKSIDVCAIFQAIHKENYDHTIRNDEHYTKHRNGLWNKLEPLKSKYTMLTDKLPYNEYIENLRKSKIVLAPFGMGELCFRDFESMQYGTIILKPSHDKVDTIPNVYEDGKTYIGCKYDWSDLEEKIDYILSNFNELNDKLNFNLRDQFAEKYSYHNLCMHYYNLFSNLTEVKNG